MKKGCFPIIKLNGSPTTSPSSSRPSLFSWGFAPPHKPNLHPSYRILISIIKNIMAANRLTPLQLAALALPWIGVQAIWSTEFGVITTVMERYELSKFWASNSTYSNVLALLFST